jgi:O-antigen ligase
MSYARIKQVAWRAFLEHPIAGLGLDQFHTATLRAYDEGALPLLYREIDPHSALFGRLAECGVIGGVTLLMLWAAWAAMARETSGHYLGYAAAAALAGLIVSSLNADIMNFRFLWVVAGLLRGLQEANGMLTTSGRGATATAGTR